MDSSLTNRKVDELWDTVSAINPVLMSEWIDHCFTGKYHEREQKSKLDIQKTLTDKKYQIDPSKNFLWRLMSRDPLQYGYGNHIGVCKRRVGLAMVFLQVMMENSYWDDFAVTTLGPIQSEISGTNFNLALSRPVIADNWDDKPTEHITTPLHEAARLEDVDKVLRLIKNREIAQSNQYGYTPLHCAAMAIKPNAKIAKLLISSVNGSQRFLNKQTDDEWGENTALHIAAANVNLTEEFVQQFKEADPLCRNSLNNTIFHVAANSRNRDAIFYVLNTFAPTNKHWDIDIVDEGRECPDKLINICARNCNAKAVELLIKHGADISQGVLHELVLESVRYPKKIDQLLIVYQKIVDNAVTWRCLEEDTKFMKLKPSSYYLELLRETMIWLLTNRMAYYDDKDALQCALDHGASVMFRQFITTKYVFRTDGEETWKWVGDELDNSETGSIINAGNIWNSQQRWNWTVFDVTNFTKETMSQPSDSPGSDSSGSDSAGNAVAKPNNTENSCKPKHLYGVPQAPDKPYLDYLLIGFDHWINSRTLSSQPLKELTRPYVALMQRFNFLLGLLQLIFMISFTAYYMPTTCSLALMFNITNTSCLSSTITNKNDTPSSGVGQQRSWIAAFWLIWPIILLSGNLFISFHYVQHATQACEQQCNRIVFKARDLRLSFDKLYKALLRTLPLRIFCCLVFVWFWKYFRSESYESYVEVTAMVILFGWITSLEFFGAISKNFRIAELVVQEIIAKDIPSFMLFFGFTVVGFSFAMHALRVSLCTPTEFIRLDETFFGVLSSAFGIGDFFEVTITNSRCDGVGGTQHLFELVYFGYVWSTMIILLNVLIAMMNHRYEQATRRAENIWRFQILSMVRALEKQETLVNVINECKILDLWRTADDFVKFFWCYIGCCYRDKNHGFLTKKGNRYYLQLVLPVDEKLTGTIRYDTIVGI